MELGTCHAFWLGCVVGPPNYALLLFREGGGDFAHKSLLAGYGMWTAFTPRNSKQIPQQQIKRNPKNNWCTALTLVASQTEIHSQAKFGKVGSHLWELKHLFALQ